MWRILLPALLAAAYASPEALVADDEANALGLLQHKGEKTATEMMSAELAVNMSQPGLAFLEDGEARFRCGVIYCADAHGNFCCRQSLGAVCCGPGARCKSGGGLAMCV
ncbi:unnamed protein product [Effrenium voratum]|nr:unnamed protein product [Effrenium voratum]|mmetsp:Transcript_77876/g.186780  ORF Transcript_77876/g.186780 Transcript_77876/m.186780 type:complete len:109 (+) Transcript_77876:60-386(+)